MKVYKKIKCIVLIFIMHLTNVSYEAPQPSVITDTTGYPYLSRDNPYLRKFMEEDLNEYRCSPEYIAYMNKTYEYLYGYPFADYYFSEYLNNLMEYNNNIENMHAKYARHMQDAAENDPTGTALNKLKCNIEKQFSDMNKKVFRNAAQMEYGYETAIDVRYDAMCKSLRDHFDEYSRTCHKLYLQSECDLYNVCPYNVCPYNVCPYNVYQYCNYDLNAALRAMQQHVKSFKDEQYAMRKPAILTYEALIIEAVRDIESIIIRASSTKYIAEKNRDIVRRFKKKVIESLESATMLSGL